MSDDIVYLNRQIAASSNPTFIIEREGKLYVTVGVLEYDPKAGDLSAEQKRGTQQMAKLFEAGRRKGRFDAAMLEEGPGGPLPVQTNPPPARPGKK